MRTLACMVSADCISRSLSIGWNGDTVKRAVLSFPNRDISRYFSGSLLLARRVAGRLRSMGARSSWPPPASLIVPGSKGCSWIRSHSWPACNAPARLSPEIGDRSDDWGVHSRSPAFTRWNKVARLARRSRGICIRIRIPAPRGAMALSHPVRAHGYATGPVRTGPDRVCQRTSGPSLSSRQAVLPLFRCPWQT